MAFRTLVISASAGLLAFTATPAAASTVIPAVFNFTTHPIPNAAITADGNVREFTAISPDIGTVKVRVTGWSLQGSTIQDSKLMVYSGGLGVISGDDNGGGNGQHTIDNQERRDFVLLQFDRHVRFVGATFNTYSVLGASKDSDATIKYGVMSGGLEWDDSLAFLNGQNEAVLNGLFSGGYTSFGGGAGGPRDLDPQFVGNIWLVGAEFGNTGYKIDGFKLASLSVIPEPATWAMMIAGFGLAGAAIRRRSRGRAAIA